MTTIKFIQGALHYPYLEKDEYLEKSLTCKVKALEAEYGKLITITFVEQKIIGFPGREIRQVKFLAAFRKER